MPQKFNPEKIKQRLQEHWNYAVSQGIAEDQILGIFLVGSQNYNFASADSDVDSKIIYLPTFEEMCLNQEWKSKELHYEKEHIDVKDIREMRNMFMKQNINFLEVLYTEYFILNPKYSKLWNFYFISNRDCIAHYDRAKTVKSIGGQVLHTLKQDPTDNKKLYNAGRLFYFLEKYTREVPYEDCIKIKDTDNYNFLWNLKYGLTPLSQDADWKRSYAEELTDNIFELCKKYSKLDSPDYYTAAAALKNGVTAILRASTAEVATQATKEQFLKELTNAEQKAYYSIIDEIGDEGDISIVKMVEKSNISRPVYANLFIKMKQCKIANVSNKGVKGTHIEITQPELYQEAIAIFNKKAK